MFDCCPFEFHKLLKQLISKLRFQIISMELNKTQSQEIHPGIIFNKKMTMIEEQLIYVFELDVQDLNIIDFEIDMSESENYRLRGYPKETRIVQKTAQPRIITHICSLDLNEGWKIKPVFRFLKKPIPKEKQLAYIKPEIDAINAQKKSMQALFKNTDINQIPIEDFNTRLESLKLTFVDNDFPPDDDSILGNADKDLLDDTIHHWRRPSDIFKNLRYELIIRLSYQNLKMGKLLDNAFFSVVVALCKNNQALIERLFLCKNLINPHGVYRFRLCKNGQWQTVTVDDYIPCEPLSRPKFISSSLNQIWIHLLQKAYAKLHKRYLSLYELEVRDVFNDLTGCPTMIISVNDKEFFKKIEDMHSENNIVVFYDIQEKYFEEDMFVPLKNYAYPLVEIADEDGRKYYRFISHNFEIEELEEIEVTKTFTYVCVCKVQNFDEVRIKGKFVEVNSGTKQNPFPIVMSQWYYSVELQQKSQVNVCLHQEDLLIGNNSLYKSYKYVSIIVFKKAPKSNLVAEGVRKFAHNREYQYSLVLSPGIYLFLAIMNDEIEHKKVPTELDLITDVFRKLDLFMRRQLKYVDLESFFHVVKQEFTHLKFEKILKEYGNGSKELGFEGFKKLYTKNKISWEDCIQQHYSKQLLFVLSFHANTELNVHIKNNIGTELNNRAHCELIMKQGKMMAPLEPPLEGYVKIYYLESKANIIEYMAENIFEKKIEIFIDCTEIEDFHYVPTSGKISYPLDSGEKKYLMKILPKMKNLPRRAEKKEIIKIKLFS